MTACSSVPTASARPRAVGVDPAVAGQRRPERAAAGGSRSRAALTADERRVRRRPRGGLEPERRSGWPGRRGRGNPSAAPRAPCWASTFR